ncbi:MAG: hypothetical protein LJE64_15705 [Desulfofustis sp.]|jgi:phosphopantothenoylcysteine synthetase/decarboxylase|nr:hypothetical protein [Desulfofustis sp.]
MQCERLIKLAKQWYLHVKEETMAPARMVQFIKQHVVTCTVCQKDPGIQDEIEKITEIILPESKIPKAVRMRQEAEEAEEVEEEEYEGDDGEGDDGEEDGGDDDGDDDDDSEYGDDDEEEPLPSEDEDD